MSLEKAIQKLTEVIQAAQLYSAQAIVGGRDDGPRQVHDRDPDFVGPPKPLPPLPPEPVDGWDCYWALKDMTDDTKRMESCCSLRPPEMTRICYYRNTPGGPIQKRPANLGG